MGAYVGRTAVKDGKGVMVDWRYADGSELSPLRRHGQAAARRRVRSPAEQCEQALSSRVSLASFVAQLLNGLAGASALFLVAAGLTLIFGVTRVVNFAHGSLYMLGAYLAYTLVGSAGPRAAWDSGAPSSPRRSRSR